MNSQATLKDAADNLHISYSYARLLATRLRRRKEFGRLCPLCFEPSLYSGSCTSCGFMAGQETQRIEVDFDSTSPVHAILPDNGLGSSLTVGNYTALARKMYRKEKPDPALLKNHAKILSHLAEPRSDGLLKAVNSGILQVLKERCPDDQVSDTAARLAIEEVKRFRMNYPMLAASKGLKHQLVENVLRRLEFIYPQLRPQGRGRNDATPVLAYQP